MNQFCVPKRRKAIKTIKLYNYKKIEFYLRAAFWKIVHIFCLFLNHQESSHFHIEVLLMKKLNYSKMKPNEQKFVFKESLMFFLLRT